MDRSNLIKLCTYCICADESRGEPKLKIVGSIPYDENDLKSCTCDWCGESDDLDLCIVER